MAGLLILQVPFLKDDQVLNVFINGKLEKNVKNSTRVMIDIAENSSVSVSINDGAMSNVINVDNSNVTTVLVSCNPDLSTKLAILESNIASNEPNKSQNNYTFSDRNNNNVKTPKFSDYLKEDKFGGCLFSILTSILACIGLALGLFHKFEVGVLLILFAIFMNSNKKS